MNAASATSIPSITPTVYRSRYHPTKAGSQSGVPQTVGNGPLGIPTIVWIGSRYSEACR
jgi:hypothetical protein